MMKIFIALLLISQVSAYPLFKRQVPNGGKSYGHMVSGDYANKTKFADDFKTKQGIWSKELCEMDSDGDGQSNGLEVGDPCCRWVAVLHYHLGKLVGEPWFFNESISNPGDKTATTTRTMPECKKSVLNKCGKWVEVEEVPEDGDLTGAGALNPSLMIFFVLTVLYGLM